MRFSKFRWICTLIGLIFSVVDIASDLLLSVQYCKEKRYVWFALTLLFMLAGSMCAQIFSYCWYRDDHSGDDHPPRTHTTHIGLLHLLQMGFFTRYYNLLKRSFSYVWRAPSESSNEMLLFGLAADLSMLRLMETFLESVPQLLLQTYIVLQHHRTSKVQYLSMAVSFLNVAWSTVDYWRCLRRSLPNIQEMPGGIPTVVYLLYKILTITARILSLALLLMLTPWTILVLVFSWIAAMVWAHMLKTDFCTLRCVEGLYRCIVGVILVFTFFNIKGKKTKREMIIYYMIVTLHNFSAPGFMFLFIESIAESDFFLPVTLFILISDTLGLGFLILYYTAFHPRNQDESDVVDGIVTVNANISSPTSRFDRFLQL
ncbi:XK-related protein 9 [Clarias gariepinus]|uniref:XK-related protein 9 n=1 Tax=Clarias gariepinus TaxID=13013 RepID=UPI00234D4F0A|nr:XK-related protein 9 [Clarias gariepinus]